MLSIFRLDHFFANRLKQETRSSWSPQEISAIRHQVNQKEERRAQRQQEKIRQEKAVWDPVIAQARICALEFSSRCCFVQTGNLQRCTREVDPDSDSLFLCPLHDSQLHSDHPLYFLTSHDLKQHLA